MMLLGRKIGMSHVFDEKGRLTPVTIIWFDENIVIGQKTLGTDKYQAIQIATRGSKHLSQPIQSILKKVKINQPLGVIREFRATDDEIKKFPSGSEIELINFHPGDLVEVSSISKGKGFAGTIKRHHFARGPKTHGSHNYRRPGSIGAQQPQRVIKGKRMAGHMGFKQVTIKSVSVIRVDVERQLIALRGSLPGPNRGLVMIKKVNHGNITEEREKNFRDVP